MAGAIVTIGEILVEIMAVEKGNGFLAPQPLIGPFASGAPAIFIDQVGRLGHPAAIVSAVGDDDFGRLNLARLREDGVDVSAVAIHPGAATGSAFVRYRPDGARDFVFNIRDSASGRIDLDSEALAVLAQAGHLHFTGSSLGIPAILGIAERAVDIVKSRGGTVSFDPNVRKELLGDPGFRRALEAVMAATDILLPSGDELHLIAGVEDEAEAVRSLLARGVAEIVLKRGAGGASHFDRTGRTDAPGFVVEEIDPTGAGDCFGATYLVCRRQGMPVAEALRYANAAGARTVTVKGPMEGTSGFAVLDAFIATTKGAGA
ncbi:tagatose kinase [Labrys monachus]|uniref:Sugar/nucleoside kinase (Ribokinase family) n=1 Tax=Labrys monachus TaxID=217067 RepID=A0ABU0FKG0_9HYPH|nr:sugar kinase [Labrys monachus]MDQ0395001.1 sugar/nucleoside kinase (ribokinase family) [Labrys monachus]